MSRYLYGCLNSWSVLILNIPCSTTRTCVLLNILLSHVRSLYISIAVIAHVSVADARWHNIALAFLFHPQPMNQQLLLLTCHTAQRSTAVENLVHITIQTSLGIIPWTAYRCYWA
jgi:hypothetical protein